jgi:Ca2+-binding EF-hand superfamily protein
MNLSKIALFSIAGTLIVGAMAVNAGDDRPFRKPDLNGDGKITTDEVVQQSTERFMVMDLNSDGYVTRDEIDEFRAQMREKMTGSRKDRFSLADTNGDGKVSKAEISAASLEKVKSLDEDGDGEISRSEFRKKMRDVHGDKKGFMRGDDWGRGE